MKTKFTIGDRISIYSGYVRLIGTVIGHLSGDILDVEIEGDERSSQWHVKQCRKLVKKKRRTWWFNLSQGHWANISDGKIIRTTPPKDPIGWIKVVEVKK